MTLLANLDLAALQAALTREGLDGWLLFDFRGVNPIPGRVLGELGMGSRRLFVLLPREGQPVALVHKIELQPFRDFAGRVVCYARHTELEAALGLLVNGRRLAMEVSPEDAIPYLDRVPHGLVQLIERLGGVVVSSAALVTRFAAAWSAAEIADHRYAAEVLAEVARHELRLAVGQAGQGLTECALRDRVVAALGRHGLVFDHPPIVAFGPNAALPHYEPKPGEDAVLVADEVVLLDLWGGRSLGGVFADQTWMGFAGRRPPEKVALVWRTVREARDAAIGLLRREAGRRPIRGYQADQAARGVIEAAGFGAAFVHRTGHSIDRDLHGSGPHLDDYETHDDRELMPGVGFSVEPGIYLPGEFGIRSEVNMYWGPEGMTVTPEQPQEDLITL
jgi:Xaa-Pro aminopeptidase